MVRNSQLSEKLCKLRKIKRSESKTAKTKKKKKKTTEEVIESSENFDCYFCVGEMYVGVIVIHSEASIVELRQCFITKLCQKDF